MKNQKIVVNPFDSKSVNSAIKAVEDYQAWLEEKITELCKRCADLGYTVANVGFSNAIYDGQNDVGVAIKERGENIRAVVATGEATLFIEFGSGVIGYGHPEPMEYGPGTWSDSSAGKGHWDDPNGWYIPKAKGGGHTYGNPANMPMYNAVKTIENQLTDIVREVFSGD